ncbi:filamentous hemagglutinin N-terminal domain-containing protein [Coleofasciculus sp. LEGE 07092]|uniref:two-partner secretion domain-containing protein n=2 Tax=unclassified Coleofasciculus TaxID=2692782 RepID=UPI0019F8084E|nr:filamentous hemagglutinin N-terminal domain-containing protein [Coleofasciculus sp. LEGE 07092]MBE9128184.1 S-layer family protein [Coleofasciculus sp. LEGE 07081]
MKSMLQRLGLATSLTLCYLGIHSSVQAQISSDGSLGTLINGSPNLSCTAATCTIGGGTTVGENLFHSFAEFSILNGNSAIFDNSAAIQRIISRVTGGSISTIDGIIEALNGNPSLFLLNPNGIVFGPQAELINLNSFVASTANQLNFADGTSFAVAAPTPLLTISIPTALEFGGAPADIQVQGSILQVPTGQTLALVGGNLTLNQGALLIAEQGRIELGSLAEPGEVSLTPTNQGLVLGYAENQNFGDIQLSQDALVDTSGEGGGDIQVQGRHVTLSEGAALIANTFGADDGGTLTVNASESVELMGTSSTTGFPSGLLTETAGAGAGGNIIINTQRLVIRDGAQASAAAFLPGNGQGGNLFVNASQSIDLIGESPDLSFASGLFTVTEGDSAGGNLQVNTGQLTIQDGAAIDASTFGNQQGGNLSVTASTINLIGTSADPRFPSGLFAFTGGRGASGKLTVDTDVLIIQDGANISTSTFAAGNAGEISIRSSESLLVTGTRQNGFPSGIFAQANPGATGKGGNLTIETPQLTIQDQGRVSASTAGSGRGGNLTLDTERLILERGGQISTLTTSSGQAGELTVRASDSVILTGISATSGVPSGLFAQTQGSGDAGDLQITTDRLIIQDGAKATVTSEDPTSQAAAGNLLIQADTIELNNQGLITGETQSGQGGNINLNAEHIQLLNTSRISTTAGTANSPGDGGFITIQTDTLVGLGNSDITANSFQGRGGQINITAQGIFGLEVRPQLTENNDITAFSLFNPQLNGEIAILTPDIDPIRGLTEPPEISDIEEIAQGCDAQRGSNTGSFIRKGGAGLPVNPSQVLGNTIVRNQTDATTQPIIEAQGWVWKDDARDTVILTSQSPTIIPTSPGLTPNNCL